ncbi:YegP family protein [Fictibacillus sp. 5RED26]|uniref:YegP family protein n=1 Tax=Fictibacillus sp. 5RED26 TaxID=2745876 RepID=UPI001E585B0A|nr:YegP family protein [Fictibacillus sp. 5RED26]MBH0159153.1 YegP family protein [Fictibacillus sp. 5RED26]
MAARFEIKRSLNYQYFFVFKAVNGETIITSEMYTTKQNCLNGVDSVKRYAVIGAYEIKTSSNYQYYFVLKASNAQIIATSETYTTKQSCENGINVVKVHAPSAQIIDLS